MYIHTYIQDIYYINILISLHKCFYKQKWQPCDGLYWNSKRYLVQSKVKIRDILISQKLFSRMILDNIQKHLFADILWNRCSWKFRKIHRTATVSVSLFNKVAGLQLATYFLKKETPARGFSAKLWEIFKNSFLIEKPWVYFLYVWCLLKGGANYREALISKLAKWTTQY